MCFNTHVFVVAVFHVPATCVHMVDNMQNKIQNIAVLDQCHSVQNQLPGYVDACMINAEKFKISSVQFRFIMS